jgi:hypothetical protein
MPRKGTLMLTIHRMYGIKDGASDVHQREVEALTDLVKRYRTAGKMARALDHYEAALRYQLSAHGFVYGDGTWTREVRETEAAS